MTASRVILASAGSGKTWQLSRAYLALLERGESPSALLATTFTRKAAGEILQRVLQHLLEAATEPAALARLGRFARELPRSRVQTLDAFFVRLAGRFAQELGLPPGFRLGSEPELAALREQAVAHALDDAPPRALAELLRQVQRDGAGRRVHETLLEVVREGHELLLDSAPAAWAPLRGAGRLDESALPEALRVLQAACVPLNAKGQPNATWTKAHATACSAAGSGAWDKLVESGLGAALLGPGTYSRVPFPPALRAALAPLVAHARAVLLDDLMAAGSAFRRLLERYDAALAACQRESGCYGFSDLPRLLRGTLALDGEATSLRDEGRLAHLLLDEFQDTSVAQWRVLEPLVEACLDARDGSRSLFCVGDVKQSIYGWRQGEPALLVDLAQRPGLAAEELDESRRSAPVVLDAVNRVFADLPARGIFADDDKHDRTALREAAAHWSALFRPHRAHDRGLAGCVSLRDVAVAGPGEDRAARRRAVLEAACGHVAALAAQAPGASIGVLVRWRASIAPLILGLRERGVHACGEGGNQLTDSAAVLAALSLLTLIDHPDDTAAAFHAATSPLAGALGLDAAAACEPALGWEPACAARPAALPRLRAASELRARLARMGHGALLAEWGRLVAAAPAYSAFDRARFAQLVDLGFAFGGGGGRRADEFVALVREQRVEDPGSAPVRVLTVHGAKGLEYDAVVLPDLDYELPRAAWRTPKFFSSRRDPDGHEVPAGPVTAVVRYVKTADRGLHPLLAELAAREQRRTLEEELCVLYVALTRARVRLDLFVEASREGARQPACRFGELLRECFVAPLADPAAGAGDGPRGADGADGEAGAVGAAGAGGDAVRVLFRDGDEHAAWPPRRAALVAAAPASSATLAPVQAPALPLAAAFTAASARLPRTRSPSGQAHELPGSAREILAAPARAALQRGLLLHRFCQEVEWLGDAPAGLPARERLVAGARELAARRGLLLEDAVLERALEDFASLLRTAAARGVFARPARAPAGVVSEGDPEVWRERRFAVPGGEGELLRGAFDRVVLWRAAGRVVAAEVIDFKSDAPPAPDAPAAQRDAWLADRVARYSPQMRDYRTALARLTGLPPASIACRLLFLQADAVRDVPAGA